MKVSIEIATSLKSTKSRISDFSVSRSANIIRIIGWARGGGEAHRAEAAARHQGRSQRMRKKIRGFIRGLSRYIYHYQGIYPSMDTGGLSNHIYFFKMEIN